MAIPHSKLVSALVKPGATIAAEMTAREADLWHGATGVAGETTEILDAVMTSVMTSQTLDQENMIEELGDIEFYLEQVRQNLKIDRAETLCFYKDVPSYRLAEEAAMLAVRGGDLLDRAKKIAIYKKPLDIDTHDAYVQALALIELHLENIRNLLGIKRETTLEENIAKLSVRYENLSYSNEAAITRADKA